MMTWIERMLDLGHSANFRLRHTARISAGVSTFCGTAVRRRKVYPPLCLLTALFVGAGVASSVLPGPSALFIPFDSCVGQA